MKLSKQVEAIIETKIKFMKPRPIICMAYQWTINAPNSFECVPHGWQALQIMDYVKTWKQNKRCRPIHTTHEIHVLRLLKLVRKNIDGIQLAPEDLIFYFDYPNDPPILWSHGQYMEKIEVDSHGELIKAVPGGLFEQGFEEIFG